MTVGSTHIGRANTPFVKNRLASQLIPNLLKRPARPVPVDVYHGPATAGAFYFLNLANKFINQPSIPGTIERSKY